MYILIPNIFLIHTFHTGFPQGSSHEFPIPRGPCPPGPPGAPDGFCHTPQGPLPRIADCAELLGRRLGRMAMAGSTGKNGESGDVCGKISGKGWILWDFSWENPWKMVERWELYEIYGK